MRYDIINPIVDIAAVGANAWFPHLPLYNMVVAVFKGHFGVAVRKILENH